MGKRIIGTLVVEEAPAILDLMASWDSHLPASVRPSRTTGLGLNVRELRENPALDTAVLGDLNARRAQVLGTATDEISGTSAMDGIR